MTSIKKGLICNLSPHKFNRLKEREEAIIGQAYYTPKGVFQYKSEVALEAFYICPFLYMKIKCKKQPENRLKTVCIRVDRSTGYGNLFTCFVEDNTVL